MILSVFCMGLKFDSHIKGKTKIEVIWEQCWRLIWEALMGNWRKLCNEVLHNLYSSPNIIRVMKSRRMRLVGMWHTWKC